MTALADRITTADRHAFKALLGLLADSEQAPSDALARAVVAAFKAEVSLGIGAEQVARTLYGDTETALLIRAAVSPATLTSAQWAGALASTAVADFIGGLGPVSAAAQLLTAGLQVQLGRNAHVRVPSLIPAAAVARFIAEGQPIPVVQATLDGPLLGPTKVAGIVALTRETVQSTAAEPIIRQFLNESAGLALDAALFGTAAAVEGERPAGLRHGITSIAATSGGGEPAMIGDIGALIAAVSAVAGDRVAIIGPPGFALKLALRQVALPYPVLSSAALPDGTIMAVGLDALVSAVDPVPEIDTSSEAVLHMESESPAAIGTAGSPPTTAAPTRSLFQTDTIALRLILGVSWQLRTAGAVAVVEDATW